MTTFDVLTGPAVVIDDQMVEVELLLHYLQKQGVAYLYSNGKEAPVRKLSGIRLAFLDIQLVPGTYDPSGGANLVSTLVGAFSRVVQPNCGPITIVFWTKHPEHAKRAANALLTKGYSIIGYQCIEKPAATDFEGVERVFDLIRSKLTNQKGILPLLIWEDQIQKVNLRLVDNLHSWFRPEGELDEASDNSAPLLGIYSNLLKAHCNENIPGSAIEKWNSVQAQLNSILANEIEGSIPNVCQDGLPDISLDSFASNAEVVARLNSVITLNPGANHPPTTGAVYLGYDEQLRDSIAKASKLAFSPENNCRLCFAIITPQCDLAQKKKALTSTWGQCDSIYHRVVFGLIWELHGGQPRKSSKGKTPESIYFDLKPFWLNGKQTMMIFHFASISNILECKIDPVSILRLKPQVAMDIQSKAAIHVNRLGVAQIE